jgi:hypothetical protein
MLAYFKISRWGKQWNWGPPSKFLWALGMMPATFQLFKGSDAEGVHPANFHKGLQNFSLLS